MLPTLALSTAELAYVTIVVGVGAYALARTLLHLGVVKRLRLVGVRERQRFESVRTRTPIEDPAAVAKERGIESIERHFSVLRRLLVPLIVLLTVLLAAPPLLSDASATTASLVGAVVAVVLGVALRPYLENAMAGLVISSSRLVRIGDTVRIDDWYGTVEDITATHTTLRVWDWRRYLVPNSRMLQSAFFNYSLYDTYQWAYVEFWVSPDADLEEVRELALEAPRKSPHFCGSEAPKFWVTKMEKDAVCCWVAAWAETPSGAWALTNDVRTDVAVELRKRGIALSMQRVRWEGASAPAPSGTWDAAVWPGSPHAPDPAGEWNPPPAANASNPMNH